MTKQEAIEYVSNQTKVELNSRNTIFANIGKNKDSWWLEPANEKLTTGFYFILNDENNSRLLLFKIPSNFLKGSQFRQRGDKDVTQIIIPISNSKFVDRKGFDFTKCLIKEIKY
ncbi:MAG TPA: hypothetical protein VF622_20420 [Segetibacter sp.]|jgi:hypothetical protein